MRVFLMYIENLAKNDSPKWVSSIREHHEDITKSLFRSISENQDSKLHHLIPEAYSPHYNFRRQRTYNVPAAETKRFAD